MTMSIGTAQVCHDQVVMTCEKPVWGVKGIWRSKACKVAMAGRGPCVGADFVQTSTTGIVGTKLLYQRVFTILRE